MEKQQVQVVVQVETVVPQLIVVLMGVMSVANGLIHLELAVVVVPVVVLVAEYCFRRTE
jgi:hypothetical protein